MSRNTVDLLAGWKQSLSTKAYQEESAELDPNFRLDRRASQDIYLFEELPKIALVGDIRQLNEIGVDDIPEVQLIESDQAVVAAKAQSLSRNDPQLLIQGCVHDKEKNVLYVQLVKADYAFMSCLLKEEFSTDSPVYDYGLAKTGVLSPFVTSDSQTYLFQRTNEKRGALKLSVGLHSVAGGFLDPGFGLKDHDIISANSYREAIEEALGDSEGKFWGVF